jgi:hypothetical protein
MVMVFVRSFVLFVGIFNLKELIFRTIRLMGLTFWPA